MPLINVQIGKQSIEKKKELVEKLTAAAVEVTGIAPESFIVYIAEFDYDSIGVGGQTLTEKFAKK